MLGDVINDKVQDVVGDAVEDGLGQPVLAYTTGMVLRLRADDAYITRTGSSVSGWADASGSATAHNFSQGTGANQPAWNTVPIGGYPTVDLDADKFMTTAAHADFAVGTGSWLLWGIIRRPAFVTNFTFLFSLTDRTTADNIRVGYNPAGRPQAFWGTDAQAYTIATGSLTADTPELLAVGIDSSANEVIYKIGAAAPERKAITVSGTGASTVSPRLHGDAAMVTYDDDRVHTRELVFHNLGAGVAISDDDIQLLANYAVQFGAAA